MLTLTALIQPGAETSSMYNKSRKVNKRHMDQKGRNKTVSIWKWNRGKNIFYRWSQGIHKKLLELIKKSSKVSGCKINMERLAVLLYTRSE